MRYLILLIAILFSVNCCLAGLFSNRYESNYSNYNYQHLKNDIVRLERKIFKQTFDYDTQENRIERLERKIFGACQSGNVQERIMLLKNASQKYKAYSDLSNEINRRQYRPPIFTGSSGSNWRNILMGNFMNQFAGTATGFTPTLTPAMDPAMMDYFEADRAGYGNSYDYSDNHRSYHNRTNRSGGAGIQILD